MKQFKEKENTVNRSMFFFFRYGTVFFFHSFNNDLLEKLIHCIGIVLCYGTATGLLWEYCATDAFLPNYIRNLLILSLGTWFTHTPFFLFSTEGFPGIYSFIHLLVTQSHAVAFCLHMYKTIIYNRCHR